MSNADAISTVVGLVYYLFVLGINLGTTILVIVAKWKINQKANEPGWAAIVPYYGQYVLFKIAGKAKLFWVTLVLSIVLAISYIVLMCSVFWSIFFVVGAPIDIQSSLLVVVISAIAFIATLIACMVINIIMIISLAKSFGKGGGFAAGLIFFPIIFYPILAFDKKIVYMANAYSQPYGQPYNQPYGQPYNQPYGQPYNQQYNAQYGQFNNQYNSQYNDQYCNQNNYQNNYQNNNQEVWNQNQQQWNPYNDNNNNNNQ